MALTVNAVSSARLDLGLTATTTDLGQNQSTFCFWVKVTTYTTLRGLIGSGCPAAGSSVITVRLSGTTGNIEVRVSRATTTASYITSGNPLAGNDWVFVAITYDNAGGAGSRCRIYAGSPSAAPSLQALGTNTDGLGAVLTETAGTFCYGNYYSGGALSGNTIQGMFGFGQIYTRVLTLGEITDIWGRRKMLRNCIAYHEFGFSGNAIVADWSGTGNVGTINNLTQSLLHPPIPPINYEGGLRTMYTVGGGGGTPPAPFTSTKKKFYWYHKMRGG